MGIGSTWRRWDPHTHFPGTARNDQFGDTTIEAALRRLDECEPGIEVVGITDYGTTRGIREVLRTAAKMDFNNIRHLFPNVEVRLGVQTAKHAYNLHLLSSPGEIEDLDRLLSQLTFHYNGRDYRLTEQDLEELGTRYLSDQEKNGDPFKTGVRQFKVDYNELRRAIQNDEWARQRCLIGIASGNDGGSGLQEPGGDSNGRRQELERLADFVLASSPAQERFWQGRGVESIESLRVSHGGPKACLHGADAHDLRGIGRPDGNRYNWIKGDPNFETLIQATIEPLTRCHVGSTKPVVGGVGPFVKSIAVDAPWFANETISFNSGLNAIIGPKGSGKTALADLVAYAANSYPDEEDKGSFINRARSLLDGTQITIEWSDGSVVTQMVEESAQGQIDEPVGVRYLSQQFVERLCGTDDGISDELLLEIERVIFQNLDPSDRMECAKFSELRGVLTEPHHAAREREVEAIVGLSRDIDTQRHHRAELDVRKARAAELIKEENNLNESIQSLTKGANPQIAVRLQAVEKALGLRESQVQRFGRRSQALHTLKEFLHDARAHEFPEWASTLKRDHSATELTEEQWGTIRIGLDGDPDRLLDSLIEEVTQQAAAVRGSGPGVGLTDDDLTEDATQRLGALPISTLAATADRLRSELGLEERNKKSLLAGQERLRINTTEQAKNSELVKTAEQAKEVIDNLRKRRDARYERLFDALVAEEAQLKELYGPLNQVLGEGSGALSKIAFVVTRDVDVTGWSHAGEHLIDHRKLHQEWIRGTVTDALSDAWRSGDGAEATAALRTWIDATTKDLLANAKTGQRTQEAMNQWAATAARWIFSTDHVTISYRIEYDGVDISLLSPGTRGIVLLLLYLAMDQAESTPLIIDQPEENLDPQSVFSELVELFDAARDRRQLIIVTHNSNLVVNTDAENVLVAESEVTERGSLPTMKYVSGGLENESIRNEVCRVLEGGEDALVQRARRLRIAPSKFRRMILRNESVPQIGEEE